MFTLLIVSALALGVVIAVLGMKGVRDHDEHKKRDYWN